MVLPPRPWSARRDGGGPAGDPVAECGLEEKHGEGGDEQQPPDALAAFALLGRRRRRRGRRERVPGAERRGELGRVPRLELRLGAVGVRGQDARRRAALREELVEARLAELERGRRRRLAALARAG